MAKMFTLKEAERAIPLVEQRLHQACEAKREATAIDQHLQEIATKIHLSGGAEINPVAVLERRQKKDQAMQQLREAVEALQKIGCQIKDLEIGLVDFPAALNDREVYLCWKLGEPRIDYWHHVDDGFAGRRPILDDFGPHAEDPKPN